MLVKVDVNAECIATGVRNDCWTCPVSHALNKATNRTWAVYGDGVAWEDHLSEGIGLKIQLPDVVREFIHTFDSGGRDAVQPFSFEVDIPEAAK